MKTIKYSLAVAALCLSAYYANAAVDVAEFPTGNFLNSEANVYNSPYYRWYDEDWGWTHNAIGGTITSAELQISAWDVDFSSGEVDNIYAWSIQDGAYVLLGNLAGNDNSWEYTTFNLAASWFDEVAAGLQIWMDIDSTHSSDTWAVTLAKSVVTTQGSTPPPPNPTVPEPGTVAAGLLLLVPFGVQGLRRLRAKK